MNILYGFLTAILDISGFFPIYYMYMTQLKLYLCLFTYVAGFTFSIPNKSWGLLGKQSSRVAY